MTGDTPSPFRTTRWTLVRRAQGPGGEARLALSELCAIYYAPILGFTRHWCREDARAEDLAHGFFEELLGRGTPAPRRIRRRAAFAATCWPH